MASRFDKVKLTRDQDRRFKLSEADVELMRNLYENGSSKAALAKRFGVSWNTVSYNVSEDTRERCLSSMKKYSTSRTPRSKEWRASYMRELRDYKRTLEISE